MVRLFHTTMLIASFKRFDIWSPTSISVMNLRRLSPQPNVSSCSSTDATAVDGQNHPLLHELFEEQTVRRHRLSRWFMTERS